MVSSAGRLFPLLHAISARFLPHTAKSSVELRPTCWQLRPGYSYNDSTAALRPALLGSLCQCWNCTCVERGEFGWPRAHLINTFPNVSLGIAGLAPCVLAAYANVKELEVAGPNRVGFLHFLTPVKVLYQQQQEFRPVFE